MNIKRTLVSIAASFIFASSNGCSYIPKEPNTSIITTENRANYVSEFLEQECSESESWPVGASLPLRADYFEKKEFYSSDTDGFEYPPPAYVCKALDCVETKEVKNKEGNYDVCTAYDYVTRFAFYPDLIQRIVEVTVNPPGTYNLTLEYTAALHNRHEKVVLKNRPNHEIELFIDVLNKFYAREKYQKR